MSFTSKLFYNSQFNVSEIADLTTSPLVAADGTTRVFDGANMSGNFSSTGTPALYGRAVDLSKTLAAADTDIDLTAAALAADVSKTVDLTGKKLVGYALLADAENAGNVTIKPHPSSNPYHLFLGTDEPRTLEPGRHLHSMVSDGAAAGAAAIDATHKNIRISGTIDDVVKILLLFV